MTREEPHLSRNEIISYSVIAVLMISAVMGYEFLESHHSALHVRVVILLRLIVITFSGLCAWFFWRIVLDTVRSPAMQFAKTALHKLGIGLRCFWPLYFAVACSYGMLWSVVSLLRIIVEAI